MKLAIIGIAALSLMTACSTTWVDDEGNFKRVFRFEKPNEVQVLHSYYRKTPHLLFNDEFRYFIVMRNPASQKSKYADWFAPSEVFDHVVPDRDARNGCGSDPPSWFAPKTPDHYEMWVAKAYGVRVFLDKDDRTIHSCGGYDSPAAPAISVPGGRAEGVSSP